METGGVEIIGTVEKLLNLGVPVAILVVIIWLVVKYAPSFIKATQELKTSIVMNTGAVTELKTSYDLQIDRISIVTTQLQSVSKILENIQLNQVKMADYDKMYLLIQTVKDRVDLLKGESVKSVSAKTAKDKADSNG